MNTYKGSCHCGLIQFEVDAPKSIEVENCNCSICQKSGYLHLIVPLNRFRLLSAKNLLTSYRFNTKIANHTFCKVCGIKPFYTPRSNPDGIDINVNCLDTKPAQIKVVNFDGKNWEQHAHRLRHKSQS